MSRIKLFCLPYAGGTAMVYNRMKRFLDSSIELFPIELAGRGSRSREPFYDSVDEAVEDIYSSIKSQFNGESFTFLGHSMGTVLEYELIYKIYELHNQLPMHAFFSGRHAPPIKKDEKDLHTLSDEEFIKEIYEIGGTPKEFFEHEELLKMFIPILKADYKIIENYKHKPKADKFDFDITVFSGKEDKDVTKEDLAQWPKITKGNCEVIEYTGGHFFILDKFDHIADIINNTLIVNN
ncbi:MAG: thioesterase domain-containing protein [Bacillota bacterium]|nr:thioesterase domain-containing protein [Bacillota bacterium]